MTQSVPDPAVASIFKLLHKDGAVPWGADPSRFDPATVQRTLDAFKWMYGPGGYFDVQVEGWEHLPARNALVVMNHSGGTSIPDVWGLGFAWCAHNGATRPLRPLAHDMVFSTALTGPLFERMGVMRASRRNAQVALAELGHDVLVLPGGDRETWRPWTERYAVGFGGRQGYVRSALEAGVPILPVAHAGAHDTIMVLSRGERLARAMHLKELTRAEVFPVHLSLPWGLAVGPMPHWPLPGPLRYRVGEPVALPDGWVPGSTPSQALVDELDAKVQARIQAGLDELRSTRAPWRKAVAGVVERLVEGARR